MRIYDDSLAKGEQVLSFGSNSSQIGQQWEGNHFIREREEKVQPFHYRMAELWTYHQIRELTAEENQELSICLQANALFARKLGELYNCTYAASVVGDEVWGQELRNKIDSVEQEFAIQLPDLRNLVP